MTATVRSGHDLSGLREGPVVGGKSPGSAYFTVQTTIDERTILDEAAAAAGMNRNQFVRHWINTILAKKRPG